MTDYLGVGDDYSYPDLGSYRSGGRMTGVLKKGTIWALGTREVRLPTPSGDYTGSYVREVNTKFWKRFQYNPAEVAMAMNAVATDPYSTLGSGGNLQPGVSMGSLTVNVDLLFTRDEEVFRAENNLGGARMNNQNLALYKQVGVQKDVYDLYRILAASDTQRVEAEPDGSTGAVKEDTDYFTGDALPADPNMASLTGKTFDLAATGSWILYRAVALQFGETNIFYGWVTSMNVVYNKFNYQLVPVWAKVTLGLDVMAARPSSQAPPTGMFGTTSTTTTSGYTSSANNNPTVQPARTSSQVIRT